MEKEKEKLEQEVTEYGNLLNLIKEEFKEHEEKSEQMMSKLKIEIEQLKSVVQTKDREISFMQK